MQKTVFVPLARVKAHLAAVKVREREVLRPGSFLVDKTDKVEAALDKDALNMQMQEIVQASTFEAALDAARSVLDMFAKAAEGVAACKKGCSHCCNISVQINSLEAEVIAARTGKKLKAPKPGRFALHKDLSAVERQGVLATKRYVGSPCPFKDDLGTCSIYAERPIACRTQLNMDNDNLLCMLAKGHTAKVPYLNLLHVEGALAARVMTDPVYREMATVSDIRDFFG